MLLEETTIPATVLPITQFKDHLRLGSGFSDDGLQDGLLEGFLRSALAAIEGRTGKILIERNFSWLISHWKAPDLQILPIAPNVHLLEVALIDRTGAETIANLENFHVRADLHRPELWANNLLPAIPNGGNARLRMKAGFGSSWNDLPPDLAQAVMLLAAHYYEYRHEVQYDGGCMPFGVSALIERYRVIRLSAGGRG